MWRRVTQPATQVVHNYVLVVGINQQWPKTTHPGKTQPVPKYPKYIPLDSDKEFSTLENLGQPRDVKTPRVLKTTQRAQSTSLLEGRKGKRPNHPKLISEENMISNEFESSFDNNLDAIFGSSASYLRAASITCLEFIYGLVEFKGEFEEDLEMLLGSMFVSVASILAADYGKVQDVERLEGDCTDSIVGDECMLLGQDFCSDGVFEHPDKVSKAHLRPLHIKALIKSKMINKVLINEGVAISLLLEHMLEKFGKENKDLVRTNVITTDYNGKSTATKGVVMLSVCVGSIA